MKLFTIKNKKGAKATVLNYGGRIVKLITADADGFFNDIVLGYDNPEEYLTSNEKYYGATIGRFGNRIANGKFSIDGNTYQLNRNEGRNTLHGGVNGFHNVYWDVTRIDSQTLELRYNSEDGEDGFPGNLRVKVVYQLTDENELKIEYFAETDKKTFVNLTHHSFFNLTGDPNKSINSHILQIHGDYYTPVDKNLIPTGEIIKVADSPFDFTAPTKIGERINSDHEQLKLAGGYDHNWVLDKTGEEKEVRRAASIIDTYSGRTMQVYTNEPGIQFYGGNFLNGSDKGKGGIPYKYRTAFCLETQHFPDSPNKEHFPDTLLKSGEEYYSVCIYKFGITDKN